ncbi:hypothetical protein [Sphingomonas japonica]|uniref:Uncharacterized protein n=1 Tax=Sphingomonas japonica TaxID=511662 RepID=A0ABX0U359_9SPHN|nr:hypothetical protein [Sphingomonas japonica]NIJ25006.1 hypothetical protein [Sphingomonas japonica]
MNRRASHVLASAFGLLALVPGCAPTRTDFPSLMPRAIEERSDAIAVVPPAPVAPDPALDRQISGYREELAQSDRSFDAVAARAERLASAAGAPGSESWIAAQVVLAELDTLRAPVVGIVSSLEALAIDRGVEGKPPYPALDAAIADARTRDAAQAARAAAIETRLGPA